MKDAQHKQKTQSSRAKRWAFRLLAVVMGLLPFLLWEVSLRVIGWQPRVPVGDPFVDFQSVRPLFVPSDDGQSMVTAQERLNYFAPESFSAQKAPHEYRIVCLGGSTVQGRPFGIKTSFTSWLELSLTAAEPKTKWEVINCGGVSYASYRLVPVLEEMLRYEPDLIILYTGHNEFLEDCSYATIKQTPDFLAHAYGGLAHLRSLQMCNQLLTNDRGSASATRKPLLPTDVEALLDYQGGLASYHRNPAWKQAVVKHYDFNLRRMVRLAEAAKVPVILVDPAVNLRDCAPFKSDPTGGLLKIDLSTAKPQEAIAALRQAVAENPLNAALQYELGVQYAEVHEFDLAKEHLLAAKEEDICPLRIIEPIRQTIRQVAAEAHCPFVEARRRFESQSEGGVPGANLFVDHVHPTIRGHQLIAEEIMTKLQELNIVKPSSAWQEKRDELYLQHWTSLDMVYFEQGRERLDRLRKWTQGRTNKVRQSN